MVVAQDGDNAINDETTAEVFRRRASVLDAHKAVSYKNVPRMRNIHKIV